MYTGSNRIKFIDGRAFNELQALELVNLNANLCIADDFAGKWRIKSLSETIEKTCESDIRSKQIKCEHIGLTDGSDGENACTMREKTIISDIDFTVTDKKDRDVTVIDFSSNKKVEFLPVQLSQNFPHLKFYKASSCSIREIMKSNFAGLRRLGGLELPENQIYAISSNTFEGLHELMQINLSECLREKLHFVFTT